MTSLMRSQEENSILEGRETILLHFENQCRRLPDSLPAVRLITRLRLQYAMHAVFSFVGIVNRVIVLYLLLGIFS